MIKDLVNLAGDKIPIICNQENFILNENSYRVNQTLPDFHVFFNPAVKKWIQGRAKNGMFIAVPNAIKEKVKLVSSEHMRVQAISIEIKDESRILIINSYFPSDPRTIEFDDSELIDTLSEIRNIIENNNSSSYILCGDINCDFVRNSGHVRTVRDFISDLCMVSAWDSFENDFTAVYDREGVTYTSKIDHFFWNNSLTSSVEDCRSLHLLENTSDHLSLIHI